MILSVPVLDEGFVRHVESWGCGDAKIAEAGIIEAARQSTQGSFRGWEKDEKLLAFLYTNNHDSPFEFAGMTIEVKAPIFVFREWHRHRIQSYNEASARYSPLPTENYTPAFSNVFERGNKADPNKQAQGSGSLPPAMVERWLSRVGHAYELLDTLYTDALTMGIPKELARITMPVGHYSQMRATANLRNWLAFLTLRMDPRAQWEIRQFANAVGRIIAQEFPRTWKLFELERDKE